MPLKATSIDRRHGAAALLLVASLFHAPAAHAFSQIGAEDGSSTQKEGIVSVPLPPLPDAEPATAEETPADAVPPDSGEGTSPTEATPTPNLPDAPAAPSADPVPSESETPAPDAPPVTPTPAAPSPDPVPLPAAPVEPAAEPADGAVPPAEASEAGPANGAEAVAPAPAPSAAAGEPSLPPAQVFYGEDGLPGPVRDLRAKLMEIARTGQIEGLRPYIETGEEATIITFGGMDQDPIAYLKSASGDGEGVEILAILLEILQAGHIRSEPATDNEIFVWPYFPGVPLDRLTLPQKVELFEIVTAGDYEEMLGFGAYNFYRAGISPEGRLEFFVAGD